MFRRSKKSTENSALTGTPTVKKAVPSIISSDLNILGNLISEGLVDIDGCIEGNVKADQVTIRPNGKVRGDVAANLVHIYGEVHGIIRASSVFLYSSCRIHGIVVHQSLSVEDGAFIDGKLKRIQDRSTSFPDSLDALDEDTDGAIDPAMGRSNLRLISS